MIIFLYGENTFLSRKKLNELKKKFANDIDPNGNSLEIIDGKIANLEQINEKISPRSLLSKKRMVIIEEIFLNKNKNILEELFNYFKNKKQKKEDNIIIFWDSNIKTKKIGFKENIISINSSGKENPLAKKSLQFFMFLAKQKYVQEFKMLSNTETAIWAKKEIEKRNGSITNQAIQILIGLIGNDLWQINNEINKLINYKLGLTPKLTEGGKPTPIDNEDVEKLIRGNFDKNIFALTDAISNNNKALAIKLLEDQTESGLTESYLINMIIRQFKILLRIKQAIDSGFTSRKIMTNLKLHPFIVQKGIAQVNKFNLISLKRIVNELIEIDFKMKSGKSDSLTMLNLLLVKI